MQSTTLPLDCVQKRRGPRTHGVGRDGDWERMCRDWSKTRTECLLNACKNHLHYLKLAGKWALLITCAAVAAVVINAIFLGPKEHKPALKVCFPTIFQPCSEQNTCVIPFFMWRHVVRGTWMAIHYWFALVWFGADMVMRKRKRLSTTLYPAES